MKISPRTLVGFNLIATGLWILLIIPTLLWWRDQITWVVFMSLYANIVGHFSAWNAARAEKSSKEDR